MLTKKKLRTRKIEPDLVAAAWQRVSSLVSAFVTTGLFAILIFAAGCMPPGPRALLSGKKLIEQGKYDAAVEKLKVATELMETNALAWNYLGLAYQHAGQSANAIEAYQKALKRNPNLVEVHYDLGCVYLDENRTDQLENARNELMAFTLRRPKSLDGLLKLGTAQLRLGELSGAEKSFNEARLINPQNPEALNDAGMVLLRRNQPRDAAAYFNSALKAQPNYAPALLNLAMVSQNYLNNRPFALQKYREYLALGPHPANWEAVKETARLLELELNPPVVHVATAPPPPANIAKPQTNVPVKVAATNTPKPEPPTPTKVAVVQPKPPEPVTKPDVVAVPDEPVVKVAQDTSPVASGLLPGPPSTEPPVVSQPPTNEVTPKPEKRGFFQRLNPANLFRRDQSQKGTMSVTPPPSPPLNPDETTVVTTPPITETKPVQPAPRPAPALPTMSLARYTYQSPARPAAGDRAEAQRFFNQGIQAEHDKRLKDAVTAYRGASQADPSYYEAQANLGLAAFNMDDLSQALIAYETALAIKPTSFNARFNFALALQKGGFIQDAAIELERVLVMSPSDEAPAHLAMAHLTLANLYAEQFHQPAAARPHYLRVLELDPQNSQGTAIRYWLRDNP